jgi:hypothetical protein
MTGLRVCKLERLVIIINVPLDNFITLHCVLVLSFLNITHLNVIHTFSFPWRYSPNLGLGLPPGNSPFHFGFPDLRQSVGLLGRVISSSQGLYLYTQKRTHIHKH